LKTLLDGNLLKCKEHYYFLISKKVSNQGEICITPSPIPSVYGV